MLKIKLSFIILKIIMVKVLDPLTSSQKKTFEFIKSYLNIYKYYPTYKEIQSFMGFKSPNSVSTVVTALVKKGYLFFDKNCSRRKIRLTEEAEKLEIEFSLKQIKMEF